MNPHRKKLSSLLQDDDIDTIIVENSDHLARVNAELIIVASSKDIVIVNAVEPETNDMQDIVDFLTSVCTRQYVKRGCSKSGKGKSQADLQRVTIMW